MFPETALVTGSAGGIGRALVAALEAGGADVRGLDLAAGFDVADPQAWLDVEPAELVRAEAEELLALWRRGALRPVVGAEFPLEQANDALDLIASRRSTGKVVLVP